jgi:protein-disulfide isomerase/uncharacterized membrane protein
MRWASFLVVVLVLLSFGGCWINQQLTALHYTGTSGARIFNEICTPEGSEVYDCKEVVKSKWSVLPPQEPDERTGIQKGIPVSLLGWAYFSALFAWFLIVGRCHDARRWLHLLVFMVVLVGCAISVFFLYIIFFTGMEARCLWCLISHGVNFLILIGTWLLFPRRPVATAVVNSPTQAAIDGTSADDEPVAPHAAPGMARPVDTVALAQAVPHPSARLVVATGLAILGLAGFAFALSKAARIGQEKLLYQKLNMVNQQIADEIRRDTDTQLARFEAREPADLTLRPDDPRRGEGEVLMALVVFSDFQCPACRQFEQTLKSKIEPAFNNLLRVYWKHLPLCTACNGNVSRNLHPEACRAAYAAEAARLQGGNDAFWQAHDLLFEYQRRLAKLDYTELARELGLEPEQFVRDMASEAVKARVAEDIALAKKLEVKATPAVYLWGRKVEKYMLNNAEFVERINERFVKVRNNKLAREKWKQMTPKQRAALIEAAKKKKAEPSPEPQADESSGE